MRKSNNAYETYLSAQIETATPGRLLLLLYDGALKRLHRGRSALQEEDYSTSHENLLRAQDILVELMVSLDHDNGGEIASNLHRLYDFMYRTLIDANVKRDIERVDQVRSLLEELRAAWSQALENETESEEPQEEMAMAVGSENISRSSNAKTPPPPPQAPPGSRLNLQG